MRSSQPTLLIILASILPHQGSAQTSCAFLDGTWRVLDAPAAVVPTVEPQWIPSSPCTWRLQDWVYVEQALCSNASITVIGGAQLHHVLWTFLNEFMECYSSLDMLAPNVPSRDYACAVLLSLPGTEAQRRNFDITRDWGDCAAHFHFRWAMTPADAMALVPPYDAVRGMSSFLWLGLGEEALSPLLSSDEQEQVLLERLGSETRALVAHILSSGQGLRPVLITTAALRVGEDVEGVMHSVDVHNRHVDSMNTQLAAVWSDAGFTVQRVERFLPSWPQNATSATSTGMLAPALEMIVLQEAFSFFQGVADEISRSSTPSLTAASSNSDCDAKLTMETAAAALAAVGERLNAAALQCGSDTDGIRRV